MNDEAVESNEQQANSHTGDPLNNKRTQIVLRKSFILGGQNPQGGKMKQWSNEQEANGHGGGPLERQEVSNEDHPLCLGKASVWHNYFEKFESRYTVTWKEHSQL